MFQIVFLFGKNFFKIHFSNKYFSESVMQHQSGLWLNKKGDMMAFMKLNDTEVESISFQNLDTTITITGTSPGFGELKYAKVSVLYESNDIKFFFLNTNAVYPYYLRDAGWILELTMTDYWDYILHFPFYRI